MEHASHLNDCIVVPRPTTAGIFTTEGEQFVIFAGTGNTIFVVFAAHQVFPRDILKREKCRWQKQN
jgi:hypothetical protein